MVVIKPLQCVLLHTAAARTMVSGLDSVTRWRRWGMCGIVKQPQTRTLGVARMCVGLMDIAPARLARGTLPLGSRVVLCISMAVAGGLQAGCSDVNDGWRTEIALQQAQMNLCVRCRRNLVSRRSRRAHIIHRVGGWVGCPRGVFGQPNTAAVEPSRGPLLHAKLLPVPTYILRCTSVNTHHAVSTTIQLQHVLQRHFAHPKTHFWACISHTRTANVCPY